MAPDEKQSKSGSRNVNLHPLVIINISDHHTRVCVSAGDQMTIGMLFGVQKGLTVDIYDSFEVKYDVVNAEVAIDKQYVQTKVKQFSAVFPDFELLGWYITGSQVTKKELLIHRAMSEFNESPLFLMIDPNISPEAKSLPISMYESVFQVVNDTPTMVFVDIEYKIDTVESERISVEHVAKQAPAKGDDQSILVTPVAGMQNSVQNVVQRMRVLQDYLRATKQGKVPKNHAMLREIAAVCSQLPVVDSDEFRGEFNKEYNDTLLVSYLASMSKGLSTVNTVIDKYQATLSKSKHFLP